MIHYDVQNEVVVVVVCTRINTKKNHGMRQKAYQQRPRNVQN